MTLILTYVATIHNGNIIANIHVNFCYINSYITIFKDYVTGLEVLAGYYTICSKVV